MLFPSLELLRVSFALNNVTTLSNAPAANTAATVTLPAPGANFRWRVRNVFVSYSGGTLAGGNLLISDGANINISLDITSEGLNPLCGMEILCGPNAAVTVTLAAGSAGVLGKLTVMATID